MSEILPLMIEEEKIMITQFLHQPPETPSQVFSLSKRKKKLVAKLMSPSAQARAAMCHMVRGIC